MERERASEVINFAAWTCSGEAEAEAVRGRQRHVAETR